MTHTKKAYFDSTLGEDTLSVLVTEYQTAMKKHRFYVSQ